MSADDARKREWPYCEVLTMQCHEYCLQRLPIYRADEGMLASSDAHNHKSMAVNIHAPRLYRDSY